MLLRSRRESDLLQSSPVSHLSSLLHALYVCTHLLPLPHPLKHQPLLHRPHPIRIERIQHRIRGHRHRRPMLRRRPPELVIRHKGDRGNDHGEVAHRQAEVEFGVVLAEGEAAEVVGEGVVGGVFEVVEGVGRDFRVGHGEMGWRVRRGCVEGQGIVGWVEGWGAGCGGEVERCPFVRLKGSPPGVLASNRSM